MKWENEFRIEANVRGETLTVITAVKSGLALQWYLNLSTPRQNKALEEHLRDLLQGKTETYESIEEHTKLFANRTTTTVKSFFDPRTDGPLEAEYPTIKVYWLVCKLNVLSYAMKRFWSGEKDFVNIDEELKLRMDLVTPDAD